MFLFTYDLLNIWDNYAEIIWDKVIGKSSMWLTAGEKEQY